MIAIDLAEVGGEEDGSADVVTRLDALAERPYDRRRYLEFFIDYVKPIAYRYRRWMLTDRRYRDAAKVLDFDDIAQIGAIATVRTCDKLEQRHPDDIDPYRFSHWLRNEMHARVRDAMEEHARKSAVALPDEDGAAHTTLRIRDTTSDGLTVSALAAPLRLAPAALRAVVGMLVVEEMRQADVAAAIGASQASVSNWLRGFAIRACIEAQNAYTEHPLAPEPWPPVAAGLIPMIDRWTRDRYGVDVDTWLRWVDDAIATDVGYLCDLYSIAFGASLRRMPALYDLDDDLEQLNRLDPPPRTIKDVQARCGFGVRRATSVLAAWRVRNP